MGTSMRELGIDQLTEEQRIELALEIWQSLGNNHATKLTEAQRIVLSRRDAELDLNPEIALTWEQIRARIEGRY